MENETDLRKYIDVLIRHWLIIVCITIVAALVTGLVSIFLPSTYEAKTAVLIIRARTELVLEPGYTTSLSQEENFAFQRMALTALVKSNTVAVQVIEQLGDSLEPDEQKVDNILKMVQVMEEGDLIEISVKSANSQKAADIANAWAMSYKSHINGLYSDISQSPEDLQVQVVAALTEYEEMQQIYEGFVGDNLIDELNRHISDINLLCQVKSLRDQIASGNPSTAATAANNLAVILLQASAFTGLPGQLQLSTELLASLTTSLDDIDDLISTIETRSEITPGQSISALRQKILQLQGELEQERANERGLENSRDIAWQTYTTLDNKAAEAEVETLIQDVMVQVANTATVPELPMGHNTVQNTVIATVLGLIAGVFTAFAIEYFKRTKGKTEEAGKKSSC